MLYLDWETHRARKLVSRILDRESERYRRRRQSAACTNKMAFTKARRDLGVNGKQATNGDPVDGDLDSGSLDPDATRRSARVAATFQDFTDVSEYVSKPALTKPRIRGGRVLAASKLGQYIMDSARLYEVMSTFQDQQMAEKYLYSDPPFHPRRTLDQHWYQGLRVPAIYNKDQVVYRGTSDRPEYRLGLLRLRASFQRCLTP